MRTRILVRNFSSRRRARIRAKQNVGKKLDVELKTLRSINAPLRASLDAVNRAGAPPNDHQNIAFLIERAVALRPCADTATEAYVRLGTDCCQGLAVIARTAKLDPVAENRTNRILSVLRHLRRSRLLPDAELLFACFETAVSAADIHLAATIHNTAIASRFMKWPDRDEDDDSQYLALVRSSALPGPVVPTVPISESISSKCSTNKSSTHLELPLPLAIEYYNGLVRAALLSSSHAAAAAALRELHARGAGANAETVSLLAAAHAELDDATGALTLLDALSSPSSLPPLALAALIRSAGRARDFQRVRVLMEHAPHDMQLSAVCIGDVIVSKQTLAAAGDDVMLAGFLAARACSDVEGALSMLRRLDVMQQDKASTFILGVVAETAWRANRPDVARDIHSRIREKKL